MRQIGAAVVPAVARAVIAAPGAPGPAAGGWRRSPDRCAPRRRIARRHAADDDDPGAGVAPQCLLRRAAPRPARAARRRNGGVRTMDLTAAGEPAGAPNRACPETG
jgi:hypothetical protein